MDYTLHLIQPDGSVYHLPPGAIPISRVGSTIAETPTLGIYCLVPVVSPGAQGPNPVAVAADGTISGHLAAKDRRPHSRACGAWAHDHGPACSTNCPTCHGQPLVDDGSAPTVPIESIQE
jgi:hypothetical protein